MPLTLPCSPPISASTWIAYIDIINVFNLGLLHHHSYHHIPYVFQVDFQQALHIPLFQLVFDPSDIITWHVFLLFFFWCLLFPPKGGEKGHQEIRVCLRQYVGGDWETLYEEHTIKTLILAFQCLESTT